LICFKAGRKAAWEHVQMRVVCAGSGGPGRRSRENLLARPRVSLVWPPEAIDGHSLIVDGVATLEGESLRILPQRAVLHRPAAGPAPAPAGACGSDCMEVELPVRPAG
jgi:hypothetical protein